MNKLTSTLAVITLAQFTAFAQPVATSLDVATANFTGEFYFAPADNFSPGSAGANQTWDYSSLELTLAGTDTTIPVSGSPYATTFPTANWCYKFTGFGQNRFYYHKLTSSKLEILSLGYSNIGGENYNEDPRTYAVFPYTYNAVYTDTYKSDTDATATAAVVTYDAYGTLIMPFGTFYNVFRQKVVANGETDYNWFNASPFYPILQTVLAENSLGIVRNTSVLGVSNTEMDQLLSVSPNPTSGMLAINTSENFCTSLEINMFDVSGRRINCRKEAEIGNNSINLDLQNQQPGIYFLKITAANGTTVTRRIIKQ